MKLTALLLLVVVGTLATLTTGVAAAGDHAQCLESCNTAFQNAIAVCYSNPDTNPYTHPDASKVCTAAAAEQLGGCNNMCSMVPDVAVAEIASVAKPVTQVGGSPQCYQACRDTFNAALVACTQITNPDELKQCQLAATSELMQCLYGTCSSPTAGVRSAAARLRARMMAAQL